MGGGGLFVDLSKVGEMCLKVNGKERNATTSSNPRHHVIHIVRQAPHKKKIQKERKKTFKNRKSRRVPFIHRAIQNEPKCVSRKTRNSTFCIAR